MKGVLLFISFMLTSALSPVMAQWHIGYDISLVRYDVKDELLSLNRFQNTSLTFLNLRAERKTGNSLWNIRIGKSDSRLSVADQNRSNGNSYLSSEHYELQLGYHHKMWEPGEKLTFYGGLIYFGHFTYYNHIFESALFQGSGDAHEMAALNLILDGIVEYRLKNILVQYSAGFSLFNYGSRPVSLDKGNDYHLSFMTASDYVLLNQEIGLQFKISGRLYLRPVYNLRYFTYSSPERLKILKQSYRLGLKYRL